MPAYRFAGLTLDSDFPFPELPPAPARRPALRIALGGRQRRDSRRAWLHRWRFPGGRVWMRLAREGASRIVQFPGLGEFDIRGRHVTCHPRTGVPVRTIRHLLLDQVLPATLASDRRLVVHASAVEINGRAVGFVGPSGAGKSTIAAALVRRGAAALTDDALVIDVVRSRAIAVPTYPGFRLWPASRAVIGHWPEVRRARVAHYTRKQRWSGPAVRFADRPLELAALYMVAGGTRSRITPVTGRRAIMALVRYSMILDATSVAAMRNGFNLAAAIVGTVRVERLVVPHGARAVEAVCRKIAERSAKDGASSAPPSP